jgi:predicted nucleotidyltransferase
VTRDELAARLEHALAGRAGVRLAVLFGSEARGTARDDSDVDVAVDAPGGDEIALAAELCDALGREVDVVSLGDASIPLLHAIVRDGVVVTRRGGGRGRCGGRTRWRRWRSICPGTGGWPTRWWRGWRRGRRGLGERGGRPIDPDGARAHGALMRSTPPTSRDGWLAYHAHRGLASPAAVTAALSIRTVARAGGLGWAEPVAWARELVATRPDRG